MTEPTTSRPKGDTYYRKRARNYLARRVKQDWWHVEQAAMTDLLARLPEGLAVFDMPFGTGRFVEDFHARGHAVSGLDASSAMLDAAREAIGAEAYAKCDLKTGDCAELPWPDASFDLVTSARFLRDIVPYPHAVRTIADLSRVLRPGGHAILQLGLNHGDGFEPDPELTMGGALNEAAMADLLGAHGLTMLDKVPVQGGPEDAEAIYFILCRKAG